MALQTQPITAEILRLFLQKNQNLLAVSKLQPIEKIISLNKNGQIHFGENYVQEALDKIEKLADLHIKWHLIGPLQKNKVKYLKNKFEYIHSVDSFELAELISKKSIECSYIQKVFLQVNLSGEDSKSGFSENELQKNWQKICELNGIKVVGLMTMPPLQNEPEENRIYFKKCFELGKTFGLSDFSMGTSQDYEVALSEGSTWIRIGTILFGERITQ